MTAPRVLTTLLIAVAMARAEPPPVWDTFADTWVGVDALGRVLPTHDDVGDPRPGKSVGIFYFINKTEADFPIFDVAKVLRQDPQAMEKWDSPLWGPEGRLHYWTEPLFGYYGQIDASVIAKHAQMLTDAGVDMLLFDTSNGRLFPAAVKVVQQTLAVRRELGNAVPQYAFHGMAKQDAASVAYVNDIYDLAYADRRFDFLWFRWRGKPLVIASPLPQLRPEVRSFFTFRKPYWLGLNKGPDAWTLDGYYPRDDWRMDMRDADGRLEQVAVATASSVTGAPVSTRPRGSSRAWRYGLTSGYLDPAPDAVARGMQFQDEWDYALHADAPFTLVYCWNEWAAGRYKDKQGRVMFVDQFDAAFSKDIEPCRTLGDNFYMQMVANVRRLKGVRKLPAVTAETIDINGGFDAWQAVAPEFRDDIGDPVRRDAVGFSRSLHYTNATGRNDIVAAKVAYGGDAVTFYVRTRSALSPQSDPDWMQLYLNTDGDYSTGWLGYDFVVNRRVASGTTSVDRLGRDGAASPAGNAACRVAGDEMMIRVPCAAIGGTLPKQIDFKWADHCRQAGGWSDFTLNGDAAPNDRFNYRAKLAK